MQYGDGEQTTYGAELGREGPTNPLEMSCISPEFEPEPYVRASQTTSGLRNFRYTISPGVQVPSQAWVTIPGAGRHVCYPDHRVGWACHRRAVSSPALLVGVLWPMAV